MTSCHAVAKLVVLLSIQQRIDYKVALWRSRSAAHRCRTTSITYSRTQRTSTTCNANWSFRHCVDHSTRHCEACLLLHRTSYMELTAKDSSWQWLSNLLNLG